MPDLIVTINLNGYWSRTLIGAQFDFFFYFDIFNCGPVLFILRIFIRSGGGGRHALFFSVGLLRQMSHSHVPIKNNRAVIFCAFEFLIFAQSLRWSDVCAGSTVSACLLHPICIWRSRVPCLDDDDASVNYSSRRIVALRAGENI